MSQVLFIASYYYNFCGGQVCSSRNQEMVEEVYGKDNVTVIRIKRSDHKEKSNKILWYLKAFWNDISMFSIGGYDKYHQKLIFETINKKNIKLVFLDNSVHGNIIKKIRINYPHIKTVTFFHNIEYLYYKKEFIINHSPLFKYRNYITKRNEKNACIYSDKIIALNQRDSSIIEKLYFRKPDCIIPITVKDTYIPIQNKSVEHNPVKIGLFVGSYFSANIEGLTVFIRDVLPKVKMKLIIIGSGMSALKENSPQHKDIEIHDFIQDLIPFYERADFVLMPIFSGSGMKVKTAEALMYGKFIIGTPEAFTGYNITAKIGHLCKNNQEFIEAINSFECNKLQYNPDSRELYLKQHTYEASLHLFKQVLNSIAVPE